MTCFHNFFTTPIWEIFAGNLLLLFCSLFYLTWWVVSFRPNSSGESAGMFYITAAFITGVVAIVLMSGGINSLSHDSKCLPVRFILLGSAALFLVMLLVTAIAFYRIVTSELIIIHIWAVLELSMVAVLYGTGLFGSGRAATLAALVGIAFVSSLVCYVLYYRLGVMASYLGRHDPVDYSCVCNGNFPGNVGRFVSRRKSKRGYVTRGWLRLDEEVASIRNAILVPVSEKRIETILRPIIEDRY